MNSNVAIPAASAQLDLPSRQKANLKKKIPNPEKTLMNTTAIALYCLPYSTII